MTDLEHREQNDYIASNGADESVDITRQSVFEGLESETEPEVLPKRTITLKIVGGAVLTAVIIGAGLTIIGVTRQNGSNRGEDTHPDKDRQPVATSTPLVAQTPDITPSLEITPTPEVTESGSYEIAAGQSAEQYGKAFINHLSTWAMMGTNDKLFNTWLRNNSTQNDELLKLTNTTNAEDMADGLLVSNWREVPSLSEFVNKESDINLHDISWWLLTYKSQRGDKEAWSRTLSYGAASDTATSETGRTIQITGFEHNNADKNRIGSQYAPNQIDLNGQDFTFILTTKIENGTERIASWQNASISTN